MTASDDDFSVSMTPGLQAETERLLSGRTRDIRFSDEMARAYRRKTWPQRSKIARAWMLWMALMAIVYVPINQMLAPDALMATVIVSGGLSPVLHGCCYLVWRRPRSNAVEGLCLLLLTSISMIAFGCLAAAAGGSDYERILTMIVFVNTIAVMVFDLAYAWLLAVMFSTVGIFFGFELFNPTIHLKDAIATTLPYAFGIFAVTIARKTQSVLAQKTFLMALRDQYRSASLKSANQQLEILATRDPLTGLGNRRSAAHLIETLWNDRRTPKTSIAFLMADIDSFKRLNDSAGHAAGDVCIQRVAATIEQTLRSEDDAVFRYGGEEFLIVLNSATPDLAVELAERIRCAVEALAIVNPGLPSAKDRKSVVTISLGIAFARDDAAPELVAKWADQALYDAKRSGRNAVVLSAGQKKPASPTAEPPHGLIDAPEHSVRLIA